MRERAGVGRSDVGEQSEKEGGRHAEWEVGREGSRVGVSEGGRQAEWEEGGRRAGVGLREVGKRSGIEGGRRAEWEGGR